jgi:hypothetical protein
MLTLELEYGRARKALLKCIVVAWLRCGGKGRPEADRVHRIWKHAEGQLLAMFGGHQEESLLGPRPARSTRHSPRTEARTWTAH